MVPLQNLSQQQKELVAVGACILLALERSVPSTASAIQDVIPRVRAVLQPPAYDHRVAEDVLMNMEMLVSAARKTV